MLKCTSIFVHIGRGVAESQNLISTTQEGCCLRWSLPFWHRHQAHVGFAVYWSSFPQIRGSGGGTDLSFLFCFDACEKPLHVCSWLLLWWIYLIFSLRLSVLQSLLLLDVLDETFSHLRCHRHKGVFKRGSRYVAQLRIICKSLSAYLLLRSSRTFSFISRQRGASSSDAARQEDMSHMTTWTAEIMGSFSPLRTSVNCLSGPSTSYIVSSVMMSLSLGMRCHFFLLWPGQH